MATVFEALTQCNKQLEECYFLYSNVCKKLEGYNMRYIQDVDPIYIEFVYDCHGKLNYVEFRRCVNTVMAFLVCHQCLREDYSHFLIHHN